MSKTAVQPAPQRVAMPVIHLLPGRERSLARRHPWIFSGAIGRVAGKPGVGDTVEVRGADDAFVARAAWSPQSQIRARVWTFADEPVDAAFIEARVSLAVQARGPMFDVAHDAARLIHAEADGLPGVIADRYGDVVVVQLGSAGAERWRDVLVDALVGATGARVVVERSDGELRALEGLAPAVGVLRGNLQGSPLIREDGITYEVDVLAGQKTGFFLDQRDNRRRIRELASGAEVLNAFCYTGGFTLAALAGGASSVLSIDSSAEALRIAQRNLQHNLPSRQPCDVSHPRLADRDAADRALWQEADVFGELRALRNRQARFDLIVLDPPKFAPTAAHAQRASRAYKDINLWALKLLRPGGLLATFSCSGGIDAALFQKIVAGAALDAGVDASIVGRLGASPDHPVALTFPEGDYLKGLLVRVPAQKQGRARLPAAAL